ncbi:cobaltochelatase subunit CobN [Brucella vulpis]|nr:cobaltochelatase subunit CobN [Brucella vulpis]CUW50914.1 cobaltochelatase subunit CobN [Brucella vulpis]
MSAAVVDGLFEDCPPDIVLNATGFAISSPGAERKPTVLDKRGNMVLQVIFSGTPKTVWEASQQGLLERDLAMNVALPEVDGRVLSRAQIDEKPLDFWQQSKTRGFDSDLFTF